MDDTAKTAYELDPARLKQVLPMDPGVYFFKDVAGRILYVGKAKNLKKRVMSYLKPLADLNGKTAMMMNRAHHLDFIVTGTEQEALILESSLIKKNMPRYNVILRDDKQYPCLRLDINEPFPRLSVVRHIRKDKALYFGPFSSAGAVRSTKKLIDRVFKLRKCRNSGFKKRSRPCLNFQMGRCLGVCTEDVSVSEYREMVDQARLFLDGRNQELISKLKQGMTTASQKLNYEKAADIRDQIWALEKIVERQHVVSTRLEDQDVIGLVHENDLHQMVLLFVRKGYVVGSRNYFFKDTGGSESEVIEAFIKQYYSNERFIPEQILIPEPIEDLVPIAHWLTHTAGRKVSIHRPLKGEKQRLVKMAVSNAQTLMDSRMKFGEEDVVRQVWTLLKLKKVPRFIEGMDISNVQGEMAVGAIVSFVDGLPHKSGYRNYRIKTVDGINDYGMMAELVERRVEQGQLPDLFLVDGGRGHLSVVKRVLDRLLPAGGIEVISIAKPDENREEKTDKIYVPGRKNPLSLRPDNPVLHLIMRIRDEAHRRAVSYHRKLRSQNFTVSELDQIPGVGKKRRNHLLKVFGDINGIVLADKTALSHVEGISPNMAEKIYQFFHNKEKSSRAMVRGTKKKTS